MMKIVELIATPGSQYHFGEILPEGELQNMNAVIKYPPSDLIFSALINIWSKVFGDASGLISKFKNDEIQLSSAFYFFKHKEKTIRFLPKPIVANLYKTEEHKKIKKINFVSESIVGQGILPEKWLNPEKCTLINDELLCLNSELSKKDLASIPVIKEITVQKVKVHTTEEEHRLYNQSNILFSFPENSDFEAGYYFYLNEDLPPDEKEKLKTVLNLLPDEGLGGDRSSGCGLFEKIRFHNHKSFVDDPTWPYLSASIANPAENENDAFEFYQITTRGGRRTTNNGRLKFVNMISDGAIVTYPVTGRIVDISPNDNGSYLRYGKIFLIPLHSNFKTLWQKNQDI